MKIVVGALRASSLLAAVLVFAFEWSRAFPTAPFPAFELEKDRGGKGLSLEDLEPESFIIPSGSTPMVHAATAIEVRGGGIRAFWYGGSREGAPDVALYTSLFDRTSGSWVAERRVTTREETARDLGRYVKKLGNPVVARDSRDRLWLFYVSVSLGGWSGSAVNFRVSEDEGASWGPARRIVSSPLANLGTLVRGPVVRFEDGSLGLPVYHELLGKFGELLRLSPDGEVLEKARISRGRTSLQPVVIPTGPREAIAFLRRSGSSPARVLTAATEDAGRSWTPLASTGLPNPDAAVSALRTSRGEIVLAFNDSEVDRGNLKLAVSRDEGRSFSPVIGIEPPEPASELAYPWLLETDDSQIHLFYSWNRRKIVHVRFLDPRS